MRKILVLIVAAALASGCSAAPQADGSAPTALPATQSPPATTPAVSSGTKAPIALGSLRLQSRWWTWASATETRNPVLDTTGGLCGNGQPDDIWLVAGSFGGKVSRKCNWPAERPLVGPVVNLVDTEQGCRTFLANATGSVTFDGRPVPVQRLEAENIRFTAEADNPSGFDPGPLKGVACGLWFAVPGSTIGKHTLVIRGKSGDFATEATYNLIGHMAEAF
ncbi:acid shock protein [Kribbella sp. NPDC056951]|uniref:acid shock protein n=1 Tax=Kribbella sp. NPDC056951 TaxID=3345978 RepID=UPI00364139F3